MWGKIATIPIGRVQILKKFLDSHSTIKQKMIQWAEDNRVNLINR